MNHSPQQPPGPHGPPGPQRSEGGPYQGPPPPPYQGPPPYHGPPGPYGAHPAGGMPYPPPGAPQPPAGRSGSGALGWIIGGCVGALVLLVAAVVVVAVVLLRGDQDGGTAVGSDGGGGTADLSDVRTYEVTSYNHVEGSVDYPQHPPVGGDHNAVWLNCGVYTEEVPAENAVHSLEHGAVWITHDPALDADQVAALHGQYAAGDYLIVSPAPDLPAPVVLSAWGVQLTVDDARDERVAAFLREYVQGPQTPEPGAPCSGGVDGS